MWRNVGLVDRGGVASIGHKAGAEASLSAAGSIFIQYTDKLGQYPGLIIRLVVS